MIATLSGEELVLILGGYTALTLGLFGLLLKYLLDTRNEAKAVNRAVNHRPSDEPSIYERVAGIERAVTRLDTRFERQTDTQTARHFENSGRIRELRDAVSRVDDRVAVIEHRPPEDA